MRNLVRSCEWLLDGDRPVLEDLSLLVDLVLASDSPMFLFVGNERLLLYNDAAGPFLGGRHPEALGKPVREVWPELYERHGLFEKHGSQDGGNSHGGSCTQTLSLIADRHGRPQEAHLTLHSTPVPGRQVSGSAVLVVGLEETSRVLAERRLDLLGKLAALRAADESKEIVRQAMELLPEYSRDVSFALVYSRAGADQFKLVGASGISAESAHAPRQVSVSSSLVEWFTEEVLRGRTVVVSGQGHKGITGGFWPEPTQTVVVIPVGCEEPYGAVVLGSSPRLPFNDRYRQFLEALAAELRPVAAPAAEPAATRASEETSTQAVAKPAQSQADLASLAGNLAHDFNNLMVGILGNASLLRQELRDSPDLERLTDGILDATQRAVKLTQRILESTRSERSSVQPVNLAAEVAHVRSSLEAALAGNVALQIEPSDVQLMIYADSSQIQQVIINLVLSTVEEAPDGMAAQAYVRVRRASIGDGGWAADDAQAQLDSGVYICLEIELRLRFPHAGSGDGGGNRRVSPAIASIIRNYGGACSISRSAEGGLVTRVFFRAAGTAGAEAFQDQKQESPVILVVDDEPIVRRTAVLALERHGFRVVCAENGLEAIEIFKKQPTDYSVVLLDLAMPLMSGEQTFKQLLAIRPDVKVIASSGFSEGEVLRRFGPGLTSFLQKPYTSARLAEKVKQLIQA